MNYDEFLQEIEDVLESINTSLITIQNANRDIQKDNERIRELCVSMGQWATPDESIK